MCGRFALTLPQDAVRDLFHATPMPGVETLDRPRYNIRPTEQVLTVTSDAEQGRLLRPMRWGFIPHWAKSPSDGPLLINARSETIAEKPAFRAACRERRCLIPADGFYEWKASAGPGKAPYWIAPTSDDPVAFAGVWQDWTSPQGDQLTTVAIVTCAANETLSPLHHRLPVAIPPDAYGLWLGEEGKGAATLMQPPAEDFYAFHAVSQRINKGGRTAPDDAELRVRVDEDAPERSDPPRLI
ncbi:MAG: SOS response-associated peptidase [Pseudomonadota bacterium]